MAAGSDDTRTRGVALRRTMRAFTLVELLVVIAVIAIVAALWIPSLMSSRRASNERQASTSLKTLSSAEADFRANDRDGNGVNDFWTADVKGLYTMTSARVRGLSDPPLRLIELEVAAADADGVDVPAGGENNSLRALAAPGPSHGYWFGALTRDEETAPGPESNYRTDTGGTPSMGSCHHLSKFGFITFPDSQRAGKYLFLVNENNTEFRTALSTSARGTDATPPGIASPYRNWPTDTSLKSFWSKFD